MSRKRSEPEPIIRAKGTSLALDTTVAVETEFEVDLLTTGGVIPAILRQTMAAAGPIGDNPVR